jgi:hypothetical protein
MRTIRRERIYRATTVSDLGAMKSEHTPSLLRRAPRVNGLFAALFIGINLLVDILYVYIDPRIRHSAGRA